LQAHTTFMNKKKILCLVAHRKGRSPGQRFRIEQHIPYLEQQGFEFTFSNIISEKDDQIFYKKGNFLRKFVIFRKSIKTRNEDLKRIRDFDAVFIYREALMHGSVKIEKKIVKSGVPFILDFDDSIWLMDVSSGNKALRWMKRPLKTAEIINMSTVTVTGNKYLHSYAAQYGKDVRIIPTTINTDSFQPTKKTTADNKICIGWTGSSTTLKHFQLALPVLKKIQKKYTDTISIKLIADVPHKCDELNYEFVKWNPDTEAADVNSMDIGIMPLPDDDWSKGKCGFKGLQYMSFEIPTIMSPVGVNTEIIEDGVNGFFATDENEWIEKLSLLIESNELRKKLGKAGRQTVVEKYSTEANKQKWLQVFKDATEKR